VGNFVIKSLRDEIDQRYSHLLDPSGNSSGCYLVKFSPDTELEMIIALVDEALIECSKYGTLVSFKYDLLRSIDSDDLELRIVPSLKSSTISA
jgi:hypothetical protein